MGFLFDVVAVAFVAVMVVIGVGFVAGVIYAVTHPEPPRPR